MKNKSGKMSTQTIVMSAILTAIVVVLQFMGSFIKLGQFSVSLVLIPIIIGVAIGGAKIGAWLGFVFGMVVLLSGDAASFLAINVPGTIITVLAKGILCGYISGLIYQIVKKKNVYLAIILASIVCPLINTGVFLIGCFLFFIETIAGWAQAAGLGENVLQYMIVFLVGVNFIFELLVNIVLSPVILRLLNVRKNIQDEREEV